MYLWVSKIVALKPPFLISLYSRPSQTSQTYELNKIQFGKNINMYIDAIIDICKLTVIQINLQTAQDFYTSLINSSSAKPTFMNYFNKILQETTEHERFDPTNRIDHLKQRAIQILSK